MKDSKSFLGLQKFNTDALIEYLNTKFDINASESDSIDLIEFIIDVYSKCNICKIREMFFKDNKGD